MLTRLISSIVALPVLILIAFLGGPTLKIATLLVSLLAMFELYRALLKGNKLISFAGYLICFFYVLGIDLIDLNILKLMISLFVLLSFLIMIIKHTEISIIDTIITIFAFFYIPFMLVNIYQTRNLSGGSYFVWLIFISAWGCDVGAYLFGKAFGKRKLIPTLSPNKTIAGAIGGVFTAGFLGGLLGIFISTKVIGMNNKVIIIGCIIICSIGAIFAQFGDLTASTIKRYTDIKDFGKIMPGHGGALDRFDSVLFTAPIIYNGLIILMNYFSM